MSSNLSVINFSVGGTLSISGKTTLGDSLLSSNSANFQGLQTTNLSVSGTSTFNNSLPTSTQTPLFDAQLTTKIYVDTADGVVNKRITDTDSAQKTYIDDADTVLNDRITDTDSAQKKYIDDADTVLNDRITSVDDLRKTYVDNADDALDTKITTNGKKGYYIQYGGKTYKENDLGFSQFIELRTGQSSFYTTFLPNPTTCAGQIVFIWNNTNEDQGVDQTGDNLFIRNLENRISIFIRSKTTEMFVSLDTKITTNGKKGYYIQYGGKTYKENDLGFSQFIELRTGQSSFYTTFLPNPTTCAGQIVFIWNNTNEDQGVDQTGDNLFIRNLENRVSIFIRSKTTEMFVSSGNNWINFIGPVLQD